MNAEASGETGGEPNIRRGRRGVYPGNRAGKARQRLKELTVILPQPGQTSRSFRFFRFTLPGVALLSLLLAAGCATDNGASSLDNPAGNPAAGAPALPELVDAAADATTDPLAESTAAARPGVSDVSAVPGPADTANAASPAETAPGHAPGQPEIVTGEKDALTGEPESGPEPGADEASNSESSKEMGEESPTPGELAALVAVEPAAETPAASPTEREIADGPLAAEPVGIDAWINSDPLTLAQLRGKVVLVDFWTYTCINCIRTFPYLKLWHSRYADDGLVILGVHTPEFEFEKDYANVRQATRDNGIVWPVAQDNNFDTWHAYRNRFWPAKYLVDRDGVIRYTHFGEGEYAETERRIRELLEEAGADLSDDLELPEDQELDPVFLNSLDAEVTPELYAGYRRNFNTVMSGIRPYIIQTAYYQHPDAVANFEAPEDLEPHHIYFQGPWLVEAERTKHARVTEDYADYITLKYSARSVNAVLTSDTGEAYRVRVTLDGEYLTEANKGADIRIGEAGESYLLVDEPRLYEIIDSPAYTQRKELRLSANSPDFGLFAFTFGIYREGP